MNQLTYSNWAVTGLEGLVTMFEAIDREGGTVTQELSDRMMKALAKLDEHMMHVAARIEDKR
jgi:hypothetical protein